MNRTIRLDSRLIRILAIVGLLAAVFSAAGLTGAAGLAPQGSSLLDGGGFPTPTPTVTLIPTLAPTQPLVESPTSPSLDSLLPTATTLPYPFPTFQSNLVGGGEAQNQASSPSLLVLALPFLCALSLLIGVGVYWFRNTRTSP